MTEIPLPPDLFWFLTTLAGIALLSLLIFSGLNRPGAHHVAPLERLQKLMRLDSLNPGLFFLLLLLWGALFTLLTLGLAWVIWDTIISPPPETKEATWNFRFALAKLAALTAVLGAVVTLPLTLLRLGLNQRQTDTAVEALFNDKINAASSDLSARRTVTRRVREVTYKIGNKSVTAQEIRGEDFELPGNAKSVARGPWEFKNEEEDDLVTRAAAIDRLEGLAHERHQETPRIARLLSVYVRELSRDYPAQTHLRQTYKALIDPPDGSEGLSPDKALAQMGCEADEVSSDALRTWARGLEPIRSDIEKAAQTLGRLKTVPGIAPDDIPIDLRGANLQGFDLSTLTFDKALLQGARMEGANLIEARMEGANLIGARMEGANLIEARMQGANLIGAQMEGANLIGAQMEGANLSGARMEGANLIGAQMEGANLSWARMEGADLSGARMEGANLSGARMEGANLFGAQFDAKTDFTPATLRGAGVKSVDFTNLPQIADYIDQIYGDASVTRPKGIDHPTHWHEDDLDYLDFLGNWRAWQETIGYTPPGAA